MEMNKTLIVSTGDTPQILSEYLFDSIKKHKKLLFDKIIIITTLHGKKLIDKRLIKGNILKELSKVLKLDVDKSILDSISVEVLKDHKGNSLQDLRSNEDAYSEVYQYFNIVKSYVENEQNNITFLISGGRKSSSIGLAQAAMFYGRRGDEVVHVLVHPSKFNDENFWFPTKPKDKTHQLTVFNLPFIALGKIVRGAGIDLSNVNNITALIQDEIDAIAPLESIGIDHNNVIIEGSLYKLSPKASCIFRYFATNLIDKNSDNYVTHNTMINDFDSKIANMYYGAFKIKEGKGQHQINFEDRLEGYRNMSTLDIRDDKDRWLREAKSVLGKEIENKVNNHRYSKFLNFKQKDGESGKRFGFNLDPKIITFTN